MFGLLFLPVSVPSSVVELFHVSCGDDARWQGDNSDAYHRGNDADDSADIGNRIQVAVTYCGQGTCGPVESVKKIAEEVLASFGVDVFLGVKHDECREEDVENGQRQDGAENPGLPAYDGQDDFKRLKVANDLEYPENFQQSRDTGHLEGGTHEVEDRQDGQQVNNGHRCEGMYDECHPPFSL